MLVRHSVVCHSGTRWYHLCSLPVPLHRIRIEHKSDVYGPLLFLDIHPTVSSVASGVSALSILASHIKLGLFITVLDISVYVVAYIFISRLSIIENAVLRPSGHFGPYGLSVDNLVKTQFFYHKKFYVCPQLSERQVK